MFCGIFVDLHPEYMFMPFTGYNLLQMCTLQGLQKPYSPLQKPWTASPVAKPWKHIQFRAYCKFQFTLCEFYLHIYIQISS